MHSNRCLYNNNLDNFCEEDSSAIFGTLCSNYHGDVQTQNREA